MTAQIKDSSKEVTERFTIEYDNGVSCDVTQVDGHIQSHSFHKGDYSLMCVRNLKELQAFHWSYHFDIVEAIDYATVEELLHFDRFDDLVHIGGGSDGMLRDIDGTPLSSIIILEGVFFKYMLGIDSNDKVDEYESLFKALPETQVCDVTEIPHYNRDYIGQTELNVDLKVSNELYRKYITDGYLNDVAKQGICKELLGL